MSALVVTEYGLSTFVSPIDSAGCFVLAVRFRVRLSGAAADNGTNAGTFATNTNNAASNTNANISASLHFDSKTCKTKDPASWQKITSTKGMPVGRSRLERFPNVKADALIHGHTETE